MKIAISGFSGSGKTSLGRELYKLTGIKLISPSFKDIAKKKGISLMELQELAGKDESIDREFDRAIKEEASSLNDYIVASWLAIWLVDADLKVFLFSPFEERVKRVALRDNMSIDEAREHVALRDKQNRERYLRLYGIDIFSFNSQSHIVLNSSKLSLKEEADIILSYFNK